MNINQHVVRRERGWAVLGEGNRRDTIILPTQEAAVAKARAIAHSRGSELIVHTEGGQFEGDGTYKSKTRPLRNRR